jgi:hypothetical protein
VIFPRVRFRIMLVIVMFHVGSFVVHVVNFS